MLPVLLVLFIVVPIAELAVIIQVGEALGVGPTIALLILDSILGSLLMRHQGRAAWRRLSEALNAGRVPAREVLDGALVLLGGALLLTPGFITDFFGLAMLLPPTRAIIRAVLSRRLLHRMTISIVGPGGQPPRAPRGSYDVEGTAVDVDPTPRLDRP